MAAAHWSAILVFGIERHPDTLRRAYSAWRKEQGLSERCDNPQCRFHSEPLVWNGEKLTPVLDHIDGNDWNNHPTNLQFVCPNCNSQLPTHGGGNKGRVKARTAMGVTLANRDGTRSIAGTGLAQATSSAAAVGSSDGEPT